MTWFYYVVVAGFGLIFGSFFNVCIYRLPRSKSLGSRSECPQCGARIRWYDNVPVLSFTILRGRCRDCGLPISWRYPLIELATSGLFVLVYWWSRRIAPQEMGLTGPRPVIPELFIGLVLVSVLIIATAVDIDFFIIPNAVIYPGIVIMLGLVTGMAIYRGQPGRIGIAVASGVGAGVFLTAAGLIYGALFMREPVKLEPRAEADGGKPVEGNDAGNESKNTEPDDESDVATGIGMGDAKLLLFTGLALGYFHWYLVLVQLFAGFLIGALVSVFLMVFRGKGRKEPVPFGPFLAAGAVVALLWGQQLVDLYLKLLR